MESPSKPPPNWGLPDWRDAHAYLPWNAPLGLFMWEFYRRSNSLRGGWRFFEACDLGAPEARFPDGLEFLAVGNCPCDPRKSGWAWEGDHPQFIGPKSGLLILRRCQRKLSVDMLVASFSDDGMPGVSSSPDVKPGYALPFNFNLTEPFVPQMERARRLFEFESSLLQRRLSELGDVELILTPPKGTQRRQLPIYLRILDARDSQPRPTYAEIAKVLRQSLEGGADAIRKAYKRADELRSGAWRKLKYLGSTDRNRTKR